MKNVFVFFVIVGAYFFGVYSALSLPLRGDKQVVKGIYQLSAEKINDLVQTNVWSHTSSDGKDFSFRAHTLLGNATAGENLYKGACDIELMIKMWRESETHNKVLNMPIGSAILNIHKTDFGCYATYHVLSN